ncbi:MAG: glutamine synthetase adenylyltransferase [Anaerolineae bacterium]|jgi:glutamate-ammonia-ligase adenylyltransferase
MIRPTTEHCRKLLDGQLDDADAKALLSPAGFADWHAAYRCLLRLGGKSQTRQTLSHLLPHLLATLSGSANPDRVLVSLERFSHSAADKVSTFDYLASNPRAIEVLVTLFAGSQFLTEILLRNPEYFERLIALRGLAQHRSVEEFYAETQVVRSGVERRQADPQLDVLRRFQRWELLRIGACDLLGLFDLPAVTAQLSNLADSLVRACLEIASDQSHTPVDDFAVIAMGKLGGQELNYSSDIDLLFIAASDAGGYQRLGERLIEGLTRVTAEGFLYRVDMRLRPWGRVGPLVTSIDGHIVYLEEHARQWEKQALLKARAVAGDGVVGEAFLRRAEPLLFASGAETIRSNAHAMKQRTEAYLREQGRDWGEVKLGAGSIRDVEFVTQVLQLAHGAGQPDIHSRNTLNALERLSTGGLLSIDDCRVLTDGYIFLRTIEHHLQLMHYRQTHALPDDEEALTHLAQRLGFSGKDAREQLLARYEQHRAAIRDVYMHHLGDKKMKAPSKPQSIPSPADINHHVESLGESYAEAFGPQEIERHTALAQRLDAENLVETAADPLEGGLWRVTIVAYDYPGELSLICGLLFAYGLSILDGNVFTYEPTSPLDEEKQEGQKPKIVDVFTVEPVRGKVTQETWQHYTSDLTDLLRLMQAGQRREARGELAKLVAVSLPEITAAAPTLYPVDIEIDNKTSDRYTVLHIDAPDTVGFLYELTNALAYSRIYIARVMVGSAGNRVRDTLYVTDADGHKITDPDRQRELRAATVLIKHFTHLLPHSPDPESALLRFRGFIGQLFERPNWPDEIASIERPEVIDALAHLLGVGEFLWDDFLRMQYANLFPVVQDVDALETAKTKEQLQAELEAVLPQICEATSQGPWRQALNAFKDREMFRIDMRHILGHTQEFWEFSEELTGLAEVVVNAAFHLCHEDLRSVHGSPLLESGDLSDMAICALGKCGGRELGFASDIELMFIYAGPGKTAGPQKIATSEFYERLVQTFVGAIYAKREGIFEIDLQLRPYGKAGSMAISMESFRRYFGPDGPAWAYERQALVKLRPIAGNRELGQEIAALRDAFVYTGEPFDATAMRAMRERQVRHLVTGGTFNAKFSPGGLVDVEYLVQGLQITHGHDNPTLRLTNIRQAMAALAEAGILTEEDYVQLRKAHTFLRWLIDGLRMVRGNAKDLTVPPYDSEGFAFLARRLRYGNDTQKLRDELAQYTSSVQELGTKLLR